MRRMGSTPQQRGSLVGETCPDVMESDDGNFLIIGRIVEPDHEALDKIGASIGTDETIISVPRRCIVDAARELLKNEDIN